MSSFSLSLVKCNPVLNPSFLCFSCPKVHSLSCWSVLGEQYLFPILSGRDDRLVLTRVLQYCQYYFQIHNLKASLLFALFVQHFQSNMLPPQRTWLELFSYLVDNQFCWIWVSIHYPKEICPYITCCQSTEVLGFDYLSVLLPKL